MIQPPIAQAKKEKSPKGLVKNASGADTHTTEIRAQKIIVPAIYDMLYYIKETDVFQPFPLTKKWQIKTKYVLTCQV